MFYAAVQMKKNRPGTLVTVIARPERRHEIAGVLFSETTTIGVRYREMLRECLEREWQTVETPVGTIRFKVARRGGQVLNAAPEFEDCVRAAAEHRLPIKEVQALALKAWMDRIAMPRFYLTTAIDYVNSRPHLGTAYEKIAADVIARYKRLAGFETHFLMGNDEHSQNVFRRARELGEDPKAYCDRMAEEFKDVWRRLDISFDDFIRTTEPRHGRGCRSSCGEWRPRATSTKGTTRAGTASRARRSSRRRTSSTGSCPIHRTKPEWLREKNYFFRLSKYRDALLRHFASTRTSPCRTSAATRSCGC